MMSMDDPRLEEAMARRFQQKTFIVTLYIDDGSSTEYKILAHNEQEHCERVSKEGYGRYHRGIWWYYPPHRIKRIRMFEEPEVPTKVVEIT